MSISVDRSARKRKVKGADGIKVHTYVKKESNLSFLLNIKNDIHMNTFDNQMPFNVFPSINSLIPFYHHLFAISNFDH
jgi:hypothetical protein